MRRAKEELDSMQIVKMLQVLNNLDMISSTIYDLGLGAYSMKDLLLYLNVKYIERYFNGR